MHQGVLLKDSVLDVTPKRIILQHSELEDLERISQYFMEVSILPGNGHSFLKVLNAILLALGVVA